MAPDPKTEARRNPGEEPDTGNAPADTPGAVAADLARMIEEHNRALHAFLMMRVRDEQEAREIAQEAYIRMLQLHEPGAVNFMRAYLFKTAANIAINRAEQRQTRHRIDRLDSVEELIDQRTPDRQLAASEELAIVTTALLELSPKCRRAFLLYRLQDLSHEEIARELHVQPRMVRHYLLQAGLYCKLRIRGLTPAQARAQVKS